MNDLELAYDALNGKKAAYDLYWRYYDGDHPVVYAASRLREIFNNLDVSFNENWCEVVVAAELERINLRGLRAPNNTAAQARLDELWTLNQLGLESDDAHEAALVTGEAFLVVWPGEPTGTPRAYYNDPRLCHVFYDSENPRLKRYAAKWWRDDEGYVRLTLYYRERIEYYISQTKTDTALSARSFVATGDPAA
ncbi:MAG: phage portal protein, partial [Kiritimatiellia bacterium]